MTGCSKKVCKECPFRRKSPAGYLGEATYDPEGFLAPHYTWGDESLPCHMLVDWDGTHPQKARTPEEAPLCRGFVTFVKNSVKRSLNPEIAKAAEEIEADHGNIFSWPHEFIAHHKKKERT